MPSLVPRIQQTQMWIHLFSLCHFSIPPSPIILQGGIFNKLFFTWDPIIIDTIPLIFVWQKSHTGPICLFRQRNFIGSKVLSGSSQDQNCFIILRLFFFLFLLFCSFFHECTDFQRIHGMWWHHHSDGQWNVHFVYSYIKIFCFNF